MTYPVSDIVRDAQGSLNYAVMALEAGEYSRMAAVARDLAEVERVVAKLTEALDGYEKWSGELANAGQMTPDAWIELDKLHAKACLALSQAEGR